MAVKTTVVMGLGRSGRAAAELLVRQGHRVVGVDLNPDVPPIPGVELELGPHRRSTFVSAERVVVSPGIPARQADLVAAREAGVEVVGELGFAARSLTAPMVAITGTNGKSTVTWFIGQILRAAGLRTFVGGNLGNPLSNAVGHPWDALVVEVSSYQLELPGGLRPKVGVVLNLTPDHLARHGDMEGYARAKTTLFAQMHETDLAVLPAGDSRLASAAPVAGARAWLGATPGVMRTGDRIRVVLPTLGVDCELDLSGLTVPGAHNRDNAATAAMAALAMGVDPQTIQEAIPTLQALEHRMEIVHEREGVLWINDSKATNIDASRVGISGLSRSAVVLLGGQAKGPGFAALAPALRGSRAVVCFGGSGAAIAEELRAEGLEVTRVASMADAVRAARDLAHSGDAVLLSPGCASFDEFDDFEHRGRVFRELATEEMA